MDERQPSARGKRAAVIGSGFGGLAVAIRLQALGFETVVFEAREPVRRAVRALLADADRFYRSADVGLRALPWRARLAVRTARLVYAAIGAKLARRDHDALAGRTVVGRGRKLALAGRAIAVGLAELPGDLERGFHPADLAGSTVRFPDDVLPV